jgi:hypothetical protein
MSLLVCAGFMMIGGVVWRYPAGPQIVRMKLHIMIRRAVRKFKGWTGGHRRCPPAPPAGTLALLPEAPTGHDQYDLPDGSWIEEPTETAPVMQGCLADHTSTPTTGHRWGETSSGSPAPPLEVSRCLQFDITDGESVNLTATDGESVNLTATDGESVDLTATHDSDECLVIHEIPVGAREDSGPLHEPVVLGSRHGLEEDSAEDSSAEDSSAGEDFAEEDFDEEDFPELSPPSSAGGSPVPVDARWPRVLPCPEEEDCFAFLDGFADDESSPLVRPAVSRDAPPMHATLGNALL